MQERGNVLNISCLLSGRKCCFMPFKSLEVFCSRWLEDNSTNGITARSDAIGLALEFIWMSPFLSDALSNS